jgi:hypothetical protein
MVRTTKLALAALLVVTAASGSVSTALADSVDGKPTDRSERQPPASLRGSPSILFENRGAVASDQWPVISDQNPDY